MYTKGQEVYTVTGDYVDDVRVLTLEVIYEEDFQLWVRDTDGDSFLIDAESVLPKYSDALKKLLTLVDLKINLAKDDLEDLRSIKKQTREVLKTLKKQKA
jgi:hypothetical protein